MSFGSKPSEGIEGPRSEQRTSSKGEDSHRLSKLTHFKVESMPFLGNFQTKKSQHQCPRTLMCPFKVLRRGPWLTHGKSGLVGKGVISSEWRNLKFSLG